MSGLTGSTLATVAAVLVVYLAVLIFIGWRAARRIQGGEDFHLAGRSLGAWAAGVSSTASSESGWVTLGAVGMTYTYGVSGLWYAPGCLLGYLVNLYWVAPRIRKLSRSQGSLTLTDILARRWGDPHHVLRGTSVVIILLAMMGYVAAQMTAAGKAFASSLGLDQTLGTVTILGREIGAGYALGVLLGAVVITLVTSLGGFRGVAWTDLFQGLLMAAALVVLPLYAVMRLGGFDALVAGLAAADGSLLTAVGGRSSSAALGFIVGNLGIGLGYPGMPHVITRYMAARDREQVRRLRLIGILWGVAVFYGAGLVGLAARVLAPQIEDGERALMVVALQLLPAVLAGIMLAAVISAILSTVSSQLLVAASAVSYDIVEGVAGKHPDDRRSVVLGRLTVAIVGLVGILLALSEVRLVFWFVLFAWSILGAAFGPLILMALGSGGINRHGALASMLVGLGVSVVWERGRDIAAHPATFERLVWIVPLVALALLVAGWLSGRVRRGETVATVAATLAAVGAWVTVQLGPLHQLYELVPAFALSWVSALVVSRITASDG